MVNSLQNFYFTLQLIAFIITVGYSLNAYEHFLVCGLIVCLLGFDSLIAIHSVTYIILLIQTYLMVLYLLVGALFTLKIRSL